MKIVVGLRYSGVANFNVDVDDSFPTDTDPTVIAKLVAERIVEARQQAEKELVDLLKSTIQTNLTPNALSCEIIERS